jgi:hypothetical protein
MVPVHLPQKIPKSLEKSGYLIVPSSALHEELGQVDLQKFQNNWADLVADPYLPSRYGTRFRRYGRFRYDISTAELHKETSATYFQSSEVNPVLGGMQRDFAPLNDGFINDPLFNAILRFNATVFSSYLKSALDIHVHLIRIPCNNEVEGVPCPEGVHSDGFRLISIHLVNMQNIEGAKTTLFDTSEESLCDTSLSEPLDTVYANDQKILHYTTPFKPARAGVGYRDTLLTSYDPL